MKQLLQAIVLIIVFAYLRSTFRYTSAETFFDLLFFGSFIYLIVVAVKNIKARGGNSTPPQPLHTNINPAINIPSPQQHTQPTGKNNSGIWLIAIAIVGLFIYFQREFLGQKSFQSLLFIDNLLKVNNAVPPVIMWCILGLFIGLIYGSMVALKKYRLTPKVVLLPAGTALLFLLVMLFVNKPLESKPIIVYETHRQTAYHFIGVNASSIPSSGKINYGADNLADQDDNTAWASEYASTTNQPISFTFSGMGNSETKNLRCVGFKITNGYRKSRQTWASFGRVKKFTVLLNDGSVYRTTGLAYDYNADPQEITIDPFPIKQNDIINVVIQSIYPGKNHPTQVAVSELIPIIEYEGM